MVVVAGGGRAGAGCERGAMHALLPCRYALPSGLPVTVKTAVALQLESKTCVLGTVVVGACCFTGDGTATAAARALLLLLLLLLVAGAGAREVVASG